MSVTAAKRRHLLSDQLWSPMHVEGEARGATIAASSFCVLGMAVELMIIRSTPLVPKWPALLAMAVGGAVLGACVAVRRLPRQSYALLFMVSMGFAAFALYEIYAWIGRANENWIPFQATKLACLMASLLAPSLLTGVAAVLMFAVPSILQVLALAPEIQARLQPVEPWGIAGFALGGLFILGHRWRVHRLRAEAAAARAEAELTKGLANAFLQLRDLMNTPLQTIEFAVGMIDERDAPLASRIGHACEQLRALNGILTRYEDRLEWRSGRGAVDDNTFHAPH